MSYLIKVYVCDKNTRKGISGRRVKTYNGAEVKTGSDGYAAVTASGETEIYVDGFRVFSGYASSAPNPIIVEK